MMTAKKKQQNKSNMVTSARTVQCAFCGKTHNVMSGDWVYNGNQIPLCHSGVSDGCCFTQYRQDREMERGEESR